MKRFSLSLVALFALTVCAIAQSLTTTDAVLVYYMPKTILAFDVTYTETTRTQGPFYQYAERYLGTKDIVMADETTFALRDITLRTKTVADPNRAYTFTPSGNQKTNIILDKQGLLVAYNAEPAAQKEEKVFNSDSQHKTPKAKAESDLAPLSEEALFASSKAKMAEAAAKQIYRIREARMGLISGDVEHMPADSKMLSLMLSELRQQEDQLVALFVGETKTVYRHKIIYLTPEDDLQDHILLRFSRFAGPVAADNLSGEPVKLNMTVSRKELLPSEDKHPKAVSEIYYNIPGEASVRLTDSKGLLLIDKSVPVAQFGVSVALPQDLIRRKPHILFNTRTGAILSVTE